MGREGRVARPRQGEEQEVVTQRTLSPEFPQCDWTRFGLLCFGVGRDTKRGAGARLVPC